MVKSSLYKFSAFIIIVILSVCVASMAMAQCITYYADPSAVDQGVTGTRTIKGLVATIGPTKKAIIVLSNSSPEMNTKYTINTSITISNNILLRIEHGAVISIALAKTLTINGPFEAGLNQVFSGSGSVKFGGSVREVYVEWWHDLDIAGAADSSSAFQSANNALVNQGGGIIKLLTGNYKISTQVTFNKGVYVEGTGIMGTIVKADSNISPFRWYEPSLSDINGAGVSNLTLRGSGTAVTLVEVQNIWGFKLHHTHIYGSPTVANAIVLKDYSFEASIRDSRVTDFLIAGVRILSTGNVYPNGTLIDNCDFGGDDGSTGIIIAGGSSMKIVNSFFEYAGGTGGTHIDINGAAVGTVITGNKLGANYSTGNAIAQLLIRGGAKATQVFANRITLSGKAGIVISESATGYGEIIGNHFTITSATDVIQIKGRSYFNIIGNTFRFEEGRMKGCANAINIISNASCINIIGNSIIGEGTGNMPGTGISVDNGCTMVNIQGNSIINMIIGININSKGEKKRATITGNTLTGNGKTMNITNLDAVYVRDNQGYVTQASGKATISGKSTSVTIKHGLSITPSIHDIILTTGGDVGQLWVSNITSDQFDINCKANHGLSNIDIFWKHSRD